jgi:hypothetical protein
MVFYVCFLGYVPTLIINLLLLCRCLLYSVEAVCCFATGASCSAAAVSCSMTAESGGDPMDLYNARTTHPDMPIM